MGNTQDSLLVVIQKLLREVGHNEEEVTHYSRSLTNLITQYALTYLLLEKPEAERPAITEHLQPISDPEAFIKALSEHYSSEAIELAFQDASYDVMHSYFSEVNASLSPVQKKNLTTLLLKSVKEYHHG